MGVKRSVILFSLIVIFKGSAFSQSFLNEYEEAKRLYNSGQFNAAASAFSELIETRPVAEYSSYFYALTQWKQGYNKQAISMCKQIISKYPTWSELEDVHFLGYSAAMDDGDIAETLVFIEELNPESDLGSEVMSDFYTYLSGLSYEQIEALYSQNQESRLIAIELVARINMKSSIARDEDLLNELSEKFNIEKSELIREDLINEKKSIYRVALVMPFMFTDLQNVEGVIRNKLVLDLYQGIDFAISSPEVNNIELYLFDTKKSGSTAEAFVSELSGMDLVIGPLYPEPISVVSDFCKEQKINMINPLTENIEYLTDNPFAFLLKPSFVTQARKAADWVVQNVPHKSASIFFDDIERDSLFALEYKSILEENGYSIIDFQSVDEEGSKLILDEYIEQYEEYYTKDQYDSLIEIELQDRFIKTRPLRSFEEEDSLLNAIYFYDEEDTRRENKLLAYENKFLIEKDSVGSIMVVSRSNAIANNLISLVASRNDTTVLIGKDNWLNFKTLNFEQADELDVRFLSPYYLDKSKYDFQMTVDSMIAKYKSYPSDYHLLGYDMTMFLSDLLEKNGKYFQLESSNTGTTTGTISAGYNFENQNDNQVVTFLEIQDFKVIPINTVKYEYQE